MKAALSRGYLDKPENEAVKKSLRELSLKLKDTYGQKTPKMLVYGSYARGEAQKDSDVDILLLYSGTILPGEEIQRLSPILADLNLRYQVVISILPVEERDYRVSEGPFWSNLRQDGIRVDTL